MLVFFMTINYYSKGNVSLRFDIIEKRNANKMISQFYFILFIYQRIYTCYQYKMDRFTYGTGFYHPKVATPRAAGLPKSSSIKSTASNLELRGGPHDKAHVSKSNYSCSLLISVIALKTPLRCSSVITC